MVKFYTENEVELRETIVFLYGLLCGCSLITLFIFAMKPNLTLFDAVTICGIGSLIWLIIITEK